MQYEYDPAKSAANKEKHGIDFEEAQALWDDENALTIRVDRPGEVRHIVIGRMDGVHWTSRYHAQRRGYPHNLGAPRPQRGGQTL